MKLKGLQDRRKRLTDEQRKEIRELYGTGFYSLNDLAKKFNVSKKTVLLIVNDESAKRAKEYRKEHWKEWKGTKEEHREAIKKTRRYKHKLYVDGKLKEEE
jgi:predicted DNA-binding protein YlxM (UPF0122 family)